MFDAMMMIIIVIIIITAWLMMPADLYDGVQRARLGSQQR